MAFVSAYCLPKTAPRFLPEFADYMVAQGHLPTQDGTRFKEAISPAWMTYSQCGKPRKPRAPPAKGRPPVPSFAASENEGSAGWSNMELDSASVADSMTSAISVAHETAGKRLKTYINTRIQDPLVRSDLLRLVDEYAQTSD